MVQLEVGVIISEGPAGVESLIYCIYSKADNSGHAVYGFY